MAKRLSTTLLRQWARTVSGWSNFRNDWGPLNRPSQPAETKAVGVTTAADPEAGRSQQELQAALHNRMRDEVVDSHTYAMFHLPLRNQILHMADWAVRHDLRGEAVLFLRDCAREAPLRRTMRRDLGVMVMQEEVSADEV